MTELISESVQTPTPTVEDYLWLIFTLQRDGEEVIGARLAELLQVSPPTVTVTLKRMVRDGWITLDPNKHIHLTTEGSEAAKTVLRRHMLVEWLLADMLNVPWSRLHDEAHQLEHYISADVEERLVKQLGDPFLCPHGNPVPGHEDQAAEWITILDASVNTRGIIRRVHEHAENRSLLMKFLEENGLIPGATVEILEILPFNETITLLVVDKTVSLGMAVAGFIYLQPV